MGDEANPQSLGLRVHRPPHPVVAAYSAAIALLLVLGVLLPFGADDVGSAEERVWSVLGLPFVGVRAIRGEIDALGIALVIGFIALLVVVALVIALVLLPAARGALDRHRRVRAELLVGLGIIGALIISFFSAQAGAVQSGASGPGGNLLIVGMLAAIPLLTPSARPFVSPEA